MHIPSLSLPPSLSLSLSLSVSLGKIPSSTPTYLSLSLKEKPLRVCCRAVNEAVDCALEDLCSGPSFARDVCLFSSFLYM